MKVNTPRNVKLKTKIFKCKKQENSNHNIFLFLSKSIKHEKTDVKGLDYVDISNISSDATQKANAKLEGKVMSLKTSMFKSFLVFILICSIDIGIHTKKNKAIRKYCNSQMTFTREQKRYCFENFNLIKIFEGGYKRATRECVRIFSEGKINIRWNCTNVPRADKSNVFFGIAGPKGKLSSTFIQLECLK